MNFHQNSRQQLEKTKSNNVWNRLYRMNRYCQSMKKNSLSNDQIDSPKNLLDFRLRSSFCSPSEDNRRKNQHRFIVPLIIVGENRKEHLNEASKGQHIGSHHFANGKHGYSRVLGGSIPVD